MPALQTEHLHYLRKHRSCNVDRTMLTLFYVLTFVFGIVGSIICTKQEQTEQLVCCITYMTDQLTSNLAHKIIADPLHSLWSEDALLPSG